MTYLQYHQHYTLPLLAAAAALNTYWPWQAGEVGALLGLCLLALLGATPWDAWAIHRGLWAFTPGRHTPGRWKVPVEEYLFFLVQSTTVALVVRVALHLHRDVPPLYSNWSEVSCAGIAMILMLSLGLEWWMRRHGLQRSWTYMRHLARWFVPLLGCLIFLAPRVVWVHGELIVGVSLSLAAYYLWTDMQAVRADVWSFDSTQVQGWKFAGLVPWEEACFFILTSLVSAITYLILLPGEFR